MSLWPGLAVSSTTEDMLSLLQGLGFLLSTKVVGEANTTSIKEAHTSAS